jgi:hypothetical protein
MNSVDEQTSTSLKYIYKKRSASLLSSRASGGDPTFSISLTTFNYTTQGKHYEIKFR